MNEHNLIFDRRIRYSIYAAWKTFHIRFLCTEMINVNKFPERTNIPSSKNQRLGSVLTKFNHIVFQIIAPAFPPAPMNPAIRPTRRG